jgi:hypothetical protein
MPSFSGFVEVLSGAIPADSGLKTALSRAIVSFFEADTEALLWIHEFGIWESCEDRHLFEGFRRSLGEHSPLHEKPGHLFSNNDLRDVGSLVAMTLYFVWGAILYSPAKDLAIEISHDEIISVCARDKKHASEINATLKKYLSKKESTKA